jgi:hypothetical protein
MLLKAAALVKAIALSTGAGQAPILDPDEAEGREDALAHA